MNGYDPISVQPQRRATVMSDKIILHIYILFIILAYLLYLYQTINQSTLQPSVLGQIKTKTSSLSQTRLSLQFKVPSSQMHPQSITFYKLRLKYGFSKRFFECLMKFTCFRCSFMQQGSQKQKYSQGIESFLHILPLCI